MAHTGVTMQTKTKNACIAIADDDPKMVDLLVTCLRDEGYGVLGALTGVDQTDAGVARTVVGAASDGTTALLSYSYDSLDKDFATAVAMSLMSCSSPRKTLWCARTACRARKSALG